MSTSVLQTNLAAHNGSSRSISPSPSPSPVPPSRGQHPRSASSSSRPYPVDGPPRRVSSASSTYSASINDLDALRRVLPSASAPGTPAGSGFVGHGHANVVPPKLFIIVRPPPSKQNHPLNLQVQYIVSSAHAQGTGSGHASREASAAGGSTASRTGSVNSRYSVDGVPASGRGGEFGQGQGRMPSEAGTVSTLQAGTPGRSVSSFAAMASATVDGMPTSTTASPGAMSSYASQFEQGKVGAPLSRTNSNRSNRSSTSLVSVGSAGSSMTSGGTTRRVTPFHNLQFHAVLTTVVTDAGTDEKVAKFLKRGIEIIEVANIEPYELTHDLALALSSRSASNPAPPLPPAHEQGALVAPGPGTPTVAVEPPAAPAMGETPPKKDFFSKFKRLSFKPGQQLPSSPNPAQDATSAPAGRTSFDWRAAPSSPAVGAAGALGQAAFITPTTSANDNALALLGAALPLLRTEGTKDRTSSVSGTRPTLLTANSSSSDLNESDDNRDREIAKARVEALIRERERSGISGPSAGKKTSMGYVWRFRKWTKPGCELVEPAAFGAGAGGGVRGEVRIEWRKQKRSAIVRARKEAARRANSRKLSAASENAPSEGERPTPDRAPSMSSRKSLDATTSDVSHDVPSETGRRMGQSLSATGHARSPTSYEQGANGRSKSAQGHDAYDEEAESDPEDSESIWICELVIPLPPAPNVSTDESGESDASDARRRKPRRPIRVHLGTLTPAPHHPKLIAQLAVPATLGDVVLPGPDPIVLAAVASGAAPSSAVGTVAPAKTSGFQLPFGQGNKRMSAQGLGGALAAAARAATGQAGPPVWEEGQKLVLTPEELEDLVSVTCLWLVVREGLGGLSKRRKGDGVWRWPQ